MKRLLIVIGLVLGVLCATSASAAAGGWAMTTLDALPDARAGATVDVGFTIRQHGVTSPARCSADRRRWWSRPREA